MAKRKAIIMVCDNPACLNENEVYEDDITLGYFIKKGGHYANGAGGGPIPETYACSEACLSPAISATIAEMWRS